MNIIEHLSRTVTPILLGNQVSDTNRSTLLEKVYAIIVARLADNDVYNSFASTTVTNEDHGFFDRFLPDTNHRSSMVRELSSQYNVPEQETQSLVSRAAPLVYNELRNLAGTSSISSFLGNNLSTVGTALPTWSHALIPAGALGLMNINRNANANDTVVKTTTRTEEHLVATPKEEGGLMKMLLPLIGLLILGALAWALLKGCNKEPETVAAPVVASTTASTVVVASEPVVDTTASTTSVASTTVVTASTTTDTASVAVVAPVASTSVTTTTTETTTISTTEPSVYLENGRLSFYFVTAKSDVAAGAKDKLVESKLLDAVKQGKKIGVSGYTDSTGDAAFNAKLSKERAQAIKKFLMDNGVPEAQIELIKPQDTVGASGKDQEGRRVDVYLVDGPDVVSTTTTVVASPAK